MPASGATQVVKTISCESFMFEMFLSMANCGLPLTIHIVQSVVVVTEVHQAKLRGKIEMHC